MPSGGHDHRRWEAIVAVNVFDNGEIARVDVDTATDAEVALVNVTEEELVAWIIAAESIKIKY